ncbi:MAG: energy transducer TonB [Gemmatimonadota bacterium]|nr:energy transducer TonB [Gemmatimonadota bacterium]
MGLSRKAVIRAVITLLVAVPSSTLCPPELDAQTNWREVRSIKLGRFRARVEVSSAHTVRLFSQLDTSRLTSDEIGPDSLKEWQETLFSQLDKPARTRYVLGNAILVEPYAADSTTIGYALTVADTGGAARTVLTDKNGIEEFLDLLAKGAIAAQTLSDAELQRPGPITEKPIALAKSVNFVYPRTARLAGLSGSALVQFIVDTSGRAKPESITCLQATYKDFADAATAVVKTMEFKPAELEGHKIEQLVQYPIDFKLNAVLPIKPFEVPRRTGRR